MGESNQKEKEDMDARFVGSGHSNGIYLKKAVSIREAFPELVIPV